jgi:hypothetical protein
MSKRFLVIGMIILAFSACENDSLNVSCDTGVRATVRDLTGLDGCGFVFELRNGTRLEPQRMLYCGTPPLPKEITEDPLFGFEFVDGKQVIIGYEVAEDAGSICMVGPIVKITCLQEVLVDETL